ncbi:MAG TPA: diguanylate cyclase [Chloroflexota bacterium]|nr:diguanylate cyclase [Chloroflexota bacterium]
MRKSLLVGVGVLSLALVRARRQRGRDPDDRGRVTGIPDSAPAAEVEQATRRFLLYFVVPLWLAAGLLDWSQHRRTHIERTAGTRESAIHVVMLTEAGVPTLLGLFLQVNAGVLLTTLVALVAHEATAVLDVAYAESRQLVTPTEQHIHSFLEVVPLMAVSFLTVLHWDQARALVGLGDESAHFTWRPKRPPLSWRYVAGLLAAITAFGVVPYAEELWRCYRVDPTLAAHPEPPLPCTPTRCAPDD